MLNLLKKLLGIGENLTDPQQYDIKVMKSLRRAYEIAELFIRVDQKIVPFEDISYESASDLKKKYARRFFDISV